MSNSAPQSFKNHGRMDPPFHVVLATVLAVNLYMVGLNAFKHFDLFSAWLVILSIAIWIPVLKLRMYPLKVQDRVIRLEERLRLLALLPAEDRVHINDLTCKQFVALRFASDDELPALFRKTLTQNLEPKAIKESIINWRGDYYRV